MTAALLATGGCCLGVVGTGSASGVALGVSSSGGGSSSIGGSSIGGSTTGANSTGGSSSGGTTTGGIDAGRCDPTKVFAPFANYPVGASPFGIQVVDLNGDGKLDVVVGDNGVDSIWVLFGKGDGTFTVGSGYSEGGGSYGLTTADFNGDGVPDVAVPNRLGSTVSIMLGDGDGGFGTPQPVEAGPAPNCVIAPDLDGDGTLDLVASNYNGGQGQTISVMQGLADGGFDGPVPYVIGNGAIFVVAADLNGDHILDLLGVAQHANLLALLIGNGDGTFSAGGNFGASAGDQPTAVALGDFNGSLGVAASDWGGGLAVLAGPIDATTQPKVATFGANPNSVVTADFDGDGILDLAVADANGFSNVPPGTVDLFIGNGDGTFGKPIQFNVGPGPANLAVADLNGDGRPDLAISASSGAVSVLLNACK